MSNDQNLLDLSKQEVILAFINKWIPDIRMDLDTYLALNENIAHELFTEQEVILAFIKGHLDDEIG